MAYSALKIDLRRQKILEILRQDGRIYITRLSELLGTTPVTIRNDLSALERDGFLARVPGGAIQVTRPAPGVPGAHLDEGACAAEKRAIAAHFSGMVQNGDKLFINSGTTAMAVAVALKSHENLHIVTNSLAVALALGVVPSFRVLLLGGEINAQYGFISGGDALEQLNRYRADWAVLAVDSISAADGATTYHPDEAIINRRMIERARHAVIAADHTKIGRAGFARFHAADESICLITDKGAEPSRLRELEEQSVQIHLG